MGLFEDLRAAIDGDAAAFGTLRVRDLIATGSVTQHTLDAEPRSFSIEDEQQDGGGAPVYDYDLPEGGTWRYDEYGIPYWTQCDCDNVRTEGVHVYLCPAWERDIDGAGMDRRSITTGDVVYAMASGPIVCDISEDEQAEQDAAERAFLRSFGMGTWLTSQPRRFGTMRVEGGSAL